MTSVPGPVEGRADDQVPEPVEGRTHGLVPEPVEGRADDRVPGPVEGRRAAVVVASNRASAGVYEDQTGPMLVEALRSWGFRTDAAAVVPDGEPVADAISAALAAGAAVVLTTGGTGISPTDRTPDVTRPLLDRELPGLAEALRAAGVAKGVPTAVLSRGLAGVAGSTLVVNLPGSRGGVKDAIEVLAPVVAHAVDQLAGVDHGGPDHPQANT